MSTTAFALSQQLADPTLKDIQPVLPGWLETLIIALSVVTLVALLRAIYLDVYMEGVK